MKIYLIRLVSLNKSFLFSPRVLLASWRKPKNSRQDLEDGVGKEAIKMAKVQHR